MKRAALALHGVVPSDRAWILGQMSESDRGALTILLGELRELGFPEPPEAPAAATPLERVRRAKPVVVARVLLREPDRVLAACLGLESWPWRGAVLSKLPRRRRDRVLALVNDGLEAPAAPAMKAALLAALDQKISGPPAQRWRAVVARGNGVLSKLRSRLPVRAPWKRPR